MTAANVTSAARIALTAIADYFGLWPNTISRLERCLHRDDTVANN